MNQAWPRHSFGHAQSPAYEISVLLKEGIKTIKLDSRGSSYPHRGETKKGPKTLLVHPFEQKQTSKKYLLETPTDLKRKPLLELPKDSKKPKLYQETDDDVIEMKTSETQSEESVPKCQPCHHCCCKSEVTEVKCKCETVKVIFAPAMMPSLYNPMPGMPYILKQPVKICDKVCKVFFCVLTNRE
ncbi:unnamed protein product [Pieris macdunnoughi]|uniref:Uncharacterized protein n=1 Tax=Pieris macdunnoughi TaxID=345717 RepID=A0A821VTH8_9NEOP|nr:unnamed protein product [Pieris macdunnoughi]